MHSCFDLPKKHIPQEKVNRHTNSPRTGYLVTVRCRIFFRFERYHAREVECSVKVGEDRPGLDLNRSAGVIHHLSYVRTEEALKRKMATFSHAGEEQVHILCMFNGLGGSCEIRCYLNQQSRRYQVCCMPING